MRVFSHILSWVYKRKAAFYFLAFHTSIPYMHHIFTSELLKSGFVSPPSTNTSYLFLLNLRNDLEK